MKVIGITGGVGSGKSAVMKILVEQYHAYPINTDAIAKEQMKKGNESYRKVVDTFGTIILQPDGEIDRAKLGSIVFSDEAKLKLLNSLTHPLVHDEVTKIILQKREDKTASIVLMESAILYQAGFHDLCDELWYVYASTDVRMKRLMETRGYTREKILAVMKNQGTEEEYRKVCNVVIENNGSFSEIEKQIELLVEK